MDRLKCIKCNDIINISSYDRVVSCKCGSMVREYNNKNSVLVRGEYKIVDDKGNEILDIKEEGMIERVMDGKSYDIEESLKSINSELKARAEAIESLSHGAKYSPALNLDLLAPMYLLMEVSRVLRVLLERVRALESSRSVKSKRRSRGERSA